MSAFAIVVVLHASSAFAEYAPVDVEKGPVERLVKNLEGIVEQDPKNASAILNLARAHAMAHSRRTANSGVKWSIKRHGTGAEWSWRTASIRRRRRAVNVKR